MIRTERIVVHGKTIGLGSAAVVVALSNLPYALTPTLLGLFSASPEVTAQATIYLRITSAALAVMMLTFVLGAVLRGAGDTRRPLYASIVVNIVSAIATCVLVVGATWCPHPEGAGSAWGSVIGRATRALIHAWLLFSGIRAVSRPGFDGWRPTIETAKSLIHIGVQTALQRMAADVGTTTLVEIVAIIGTEALAAQQILFTPF